MGGGGVNWVYFDNNIYKIRQKQLEFCLTNFINIIVSTYTTGCPV
jgi:hypothetical protein